MKPTVVAFIIVISSAPAILGQWSYVATGPVGVRAIVPLSDGTLAGFASDGQQSSIFSIRGSRVHKKASFPAPPFLAYVTDPSNRLFCLPESGSQEHLVCRDGELQIVEKIAVPGSLTFGTFASADSLWLTVAVPGVERPLLIHLARSGKTWIERDRRSSPECEHGTSTSCGEMEIHSSANPVQIYMFPVMGSFDGRNFVYPSVTLWDMKALRRLGTWPIPPEGLPTSSGDEMQRFAGRTFRAVYRSAVSPNGTMALIPLLPTTTRQKPKHDQVWLRSNSGKGWRKIAVTRNTTAVAFRQEKLMIATDDGRIWEWRN